MKEKNSSIYLDANATEPLRMSAKNVLSTFLEEPFGNPSSIHAYGRHSRKFIEQSRDDIAHFFGRDADNIIFTSGATEADALAIYGLGHLKNKFILIGDTEHPAVYNAAEEFSGRGVFKIPVNKDGLHDLNILEETLSDKPNSLVCIMAANNETGIISDIPSIAQICHDHNAHLHIDAVQAIGRPFLEGGWDWQAPLIKKASIAISGHKFGGLMGAGALILPHDVKCFPLFLGGGQEQGRRGGTPPLPAICAMAAALTESRIQNWDPINLMRLHIEKELQELGSIIIGKNNHRLLNTISVVTKDISSQVQLMKLDMDDIAISAGSACSSGKLLGSSVLKAMGLEDYAPNVIRISLPWNSKKDHIDRFLDVYTTMVKNFRA